MSEDTEMYAYTSVFCDEILFKQPESTHVGDCPLCCLPLPLDVTKIVTHHCCSKSICKGCSFANKMRIYEGRLEQSCLFCRNPTPSTSEQCKKLRMKRIKANDPDAMVSMGVEQFNKRDYVSAANYYKQAAKLGDAMAHFKLAMLCLGGNGVEKDMDKGFCHFEEAAIGGHPDARFILGCNEMGVKCNVERAVKHFTIAAAQGQGDATKELTKAFKKGLVSKEDLTAALRAYQAAVNAVKSPERERAEELYHIYFRSA